LHILEPHAYPVGIRVFIETGNSTSVLLVSFFAGLPDQSAVLLEVPAQAG
jgi:hypothetical protein